MLPGTGADAKISSPDGCGPASLSFPKRFRAVCKRGRPLDGWDASESLLRGHTTGHFLSALALCFRICRDEELKAKAGYMVRSLKECQDSFWAGHRAAEGFLSGYSEEQFDLLEKYTPYPRSGLRIIHYINYLQGC